MVFLKRRQALIKVSGEKGAHVWMGYRKVKTEMNPKWLLQKMWQLKIEKRIRRDIFVPVPIFDKNTFFRSQWFQNEDLNMNFM